MERSGYTPGLILCLIFLLMWLPGPTRAREDGIPDVERSIQQRLRADLKQLRRQVETLNNENQRLRERLQDLKLRLNPEADTRVKSSGLPETRDTGALQQREWRDAVVAFVLRIGQRNPSVIPRLIQELERLQGSEHQGQLRNAPDRRSEEWETLPGLAFPIRTTPLQHERRHTVRKDDTLSKLALQYYRDGTLWKRLYRVNRERLPSSEILPEGTVLRLPGIQELTGRSTPAN